MFIRLYTVAQTSARAQAKLQCLSIDGPLVSIKIHKTLYNTTLCTVLICKKTYGPIFDLNIHLQQERNRNFPVAGVMIPAAAGFI